jgi:hypothetical protein
MSMCGSRDIMFSIMYIMTTMFVFSLSFAGNICYE